MRESKKAPTTSLRSLTDAFVDLLFEASDAELDEALADNGEDPDELAERAELAIDRAIARVDVAQDVARRLATPQTALHHGLSALLDQLMRRDATDTATLALTVDVEPEELEQIRRDATYRPGLRTLFRLENHFKLPARSLGLLSGAVQGRTHQLEERVTRFAAHSGKDPGRLSRQERRELTAFIRYLAEVTDEEDQT
jgi:hypothetical protein